MGFDDELLEQFDVVASRVLFGKRVCADVIAFMKKLSTLEESYSRTLLQLAKTGGGGGLFNKKSSANQEKNTLGTGWEAIRSFCTELSSIHGNLAKQIQNEVSLPLQNYNKNTGRNKDKMVADGNQILKKLKSSRKQFEELKLKFEKQNQLLESAQRSNDPMRINQLQAEARRLEGSLQKASSDAQNYTQRYKTQIPSSLKEFEKMEIERIDLLKGSFLTFTRVQEDFAKAEVMSNVQQMKQAVTKINPQTDVTGFISENKSKKSVLDRLDDFNPEYGSSYGSANFKSSLPERAISGPSAPSSSGSKSGGGSGFGAGFGGGANRDADRGGGANRDADRGGGRNELSVSGPTSSKGFGGPAAGGFGGGGGGFGGPKKTVTNNATSPPKKEKEEEKKNYSSNDNAAEDDNKQEARALYDYEASDEGELSFLDGDVMIVLRKDPSGWWTVELNGEIGNIPSNYVEMLK